MGAIEKTYAEFYNLQDLPKEILGWLRLDRIGLPHVRSSKAL